MIGGYVVQVIDGTTIGEPWHFIEVLDTDSFDRCWRAVEPDAGVRAGDRIWWQSKKGRLTRDGAFVDRAIGACTPSSHPFTRRWVSR